MKSTISTLAAATLAASLLLTQVACTDKTETPAAENPALAASVPEGMVRGTVLETMDSGGYTYVLLDTGESKDWHATQQSTVNVGDVAQTSRGMAMQEFTSKTLNRTFDVIYFSGALENLSAAAETPAAQAEMALPPGHPTMSADQDVADSMSEDTSVAFLEEGKDIAWVYANKDSLAGEPVSLRGKVVKYNANILGTNFIHIQDSSGNVDSGDNDLIVTTNTEVAVGDTVIATGKIVLDKDFGAGYSYPVLLEDAAVTIE